MIHSAQSEGRIRFAPASWEQRSNAFANKLRKIIASKVGASNVQAMVSRPHSGTERVGVRGGHRRAARHWYS